MKMLAGPFLLGEAGGGVRRERGSEAMKWAILILMAAMLGGCDEPDAAKPECDSNAIGQDLEVCYGGCSSGTDSACYSACLHDRVEEASQCSGYSHDASCLSSCVDDFDACVMAAGGDIDVLTCCYQNISSDDDHCADMGISPLNECESDCYVG